MRTVTRAKQDEQPDAGAPEPGPVTGPDEPPSEHAGAGRGWRSAAILDDSVSASVLHAVWAGDNVVAASPPGSGKTRLVTLLAATLADRADLRVGVAAQTREQAVEIARRLAVVTDRARLGWSASAPAPDLGSSAVPIMMGSTVRFPGSGGGVVVATTSKWLASAPSNLGADVLVVDEAWQQTFADLGALGAFASQVVCVGDPGQIDPVVTGPTGRWQDDPSGPHRSAPDALRAAYADAVSEVSLRHTWRLGPQTVALIQPVFYPTLPFTSRRPDEYLTDAHGRRLPEVVMTTVPVAGGPTDPALVAAIADAARSMIGLPLVTTEDSRPLTEADLIVVCPHVSQSAAVRAMLSDLPEVMVGTANAVQGMERAVAVVAHPMAGYRQASPFALDLGRTCVMLSRHRAHLHVVADDSTPAILADAAATDPAAHAHRDLWRRLDT